MWHGLPTVPQPVCPCGTVGRPCHNPTPSLVRRARRPASLLLRLIEAFLPPVPHLLDGAALLLPSLAARPALAAGARAAGALARAAAPAAPAALARAAAGRP